MSAITDVSSLIRAHEGLRLTVYTDSRGHPTIGVGRCLDTKGISADEAQHLLANDINECHDDLVVLLGPAFRDAGYARQAALIDMRFNLGPGGFREFVTMIAAVKDGMWATAAAAALASKWAGQVGQRARDDAELLRTNEFPLQEAS